MRLSQAKKTKSNPTIAQASTT